MADGRRQTADGLIDLSRKKGKEERRQEKERKEERREKFVNEMMIITTLST